MTVVEIKSNLHQLIDKEEDIDKLTRIQRILDEKGLFEGLSQAEKEAIEEGLNQLDSGQGVSHKKVIEMFRSEFGYGG